MKKEKKKNLWVMRGGKKRISGERFAAGVFKNASLQQLEQDLSSAREGYLSMKIPNRGKYGV